MSRAMALGVLCLLAWLPAVGCSSFKALQGYYPTRQEIQKEHPPRSKADEVVQKQIHKVAVESLREDPEIKGQLAKIAATRAEYKPGTGQAVDKLAADIEALPGAPEAHGPYFEKTRADLDEFEGSLTDLEFLRGKMTKSEETGKSYIRANFERVGNAVLREEIALQQERLANLGRALAPAGTSPKEKKPEEGASGG